MLFTSNMKSATRNRLSFSNMRLLTTTIKSFLAVIFIICLGHIDIQCEAKVFERCELARLLRQRHGLSLEEVANWVCIAQHASGLNSAAYAGGLEGGSHGIFQISDVYWCAPPGKGFACNVACERLRDNDLTDDFACVRIIFAEHQRISGNGYTAWNAYGQHCRQNTLSYIEGCFTNEHHQNRLMTYQAQPSTALAIYSNSINDYTPKKSGKVYNRCELAQELYYKHKMPMEQIATWVCIVQHESRFDTSAVGRLNADGSEDHGLFQISDLFWCSHDRYSGGKACGLSCSKLLDNDITDDVRCIRRIHDEHTRISGDGFTAWTVYNPHCRNQQYERVSQCFNQQTQLPKSYATTNVTPPQRTYTQTYSSQNTQNRQQYSHKHQTNNHKQTAVHQYYESNPFLKHVLSSSSAQHHQAKPQQHISSYQHQHQHQHHKNHNTQNTAQSQSGSASHYHDPYKQHKGKVYNRCQLAQELYFNHKFPMQDIAMWVCIAEHESRFDTSAVGRLNGDGSADHGLFQISDLYWCTHDTYGDKGCGLPCHKLLDTDLTDDIKCIRTIHDEHTRISGDGFTAWTVYNRDCKNRAYTIVDCFDKGTHSFGVSLGSEQNINSIEGEIIKSGQPISTVSKGKVYKKCELAQELYFKHKMPMNQVPTWVCIAQHESNYDTSAVGRLNADGSADHGLFQISDLFWCSHDAYGGKACNIPCSKLLDTDITDDVHCIKIIFDEHTRISGDGFTAWTVYKRNCQNQHLTQISNCFDAELIKKFENEPFKPVTTIPTTTVIQNINQNQGPSFNQISYNSIKNHKTKGPLNHPFDENPFLNKLNATSQILMKTTITTTPPSLSTTVVSTDSQRPNYIANPFLNKFIKKGHENEKFSVVTIQKPENSFFNTLNSIPKKGTQVSQQQFQVSNLQANYQHNPFLNQFGQSNAQKAQIFIKHDKVFQNTKPYQGNPFLQNMQQKSTKDISQIPTQTPQKHLQLMPKTPTAITIKKQTTYVNSNIFRTTINPTTPNPVYTTTTSKPTTITPTTKIYQETKKFIPTIAASTSTTTKVPIFINKSQIKSPTTITNKPSTIELSEFNTTPKPLITTAKQPTTTTSFYLNNKNLGAKLPATEQQKTTKKLQTQFSTQKPIIFFKISTTTSTTTKKPFVASSTIRQPILVSTTKSLYSNSTTTSSKTISPTTQKTTASISTTIKQPHVLISTTKQPQTIWSTTQKRKTNWSTTPKTISLISSTQKPAMAIWSTTQRPVKLTETTQKLSTSIWTTTRKPPNLYQTTQRSKTNWSTTQKPKTNWSTTKKLENLISSTQKPITTIWTTTRKPINLIQTTQKLKTNFPTTQKPNVNWSITKRTVNSISSTQKPSPTIWTTTRKPANLIQKTLTPPKNWSTTQKSKINWSTTSKSVNSISATQKPKINWSTTSKSVNSISSTQKPIPTNWSTTQKPTTQKPKTNWSTTTKSINSISSTQKPITTIWTTTRKPVAFISTTQKPKTIWSTTTKRINLNSTTQKANTTSSTKTTLAKLSSTTKNSTTSIPTTIITEKLITSSSSTIQNSTIKPQTTKWSYNWQDNFSTVKSTNKTATAKITTTNFLANNKSVSTTTKKSFTNTKTNNKEQPIKYAGITRQDYNDKYRQDPFSHPFFDKYREQFQYLFNSSIPTKS